MPYPRAKGPWKRRPAIDDLVDPARKEKTRPKSWREHLAEEKRSIDSLNYGHAWALLIKWRYVYDEAGTPMIDPVLFASIVKEAEEWQRQFGNARPVAILERVRTALWTARARLEEPELEPVEFG